MRYANPPRPSRHPDNPLNKSNCDAKEPYPLYHRWEEIVSIISVETCVNETNRVKVILYVLVRLIYHNKKRDKVKKGYEKIVFLITFFNPSLLLYIPIDVAEIMKYNPRPNRLNGNCLFRNHPHNNQSRVTSHQSPKPQMTLSESNFFYIIHPFQVPQGQKTIGSLTMMRNREAHGHPYRGWIIFLFDGMEIGNSYLLAS